MVAIRVLSLLLVLGWASTADAASTDYAYEQVGAAGINNAIDVQACACNDTDGCYAKGGLPCPSGARCDYASVPKGRCAQGDAGTGCVFPEGAGVCVEGAAADGTGGTVTAVPCVPGCVLPANPAASSGKACILGAAKNTAEGCYGDEVCAAGADPDDAGRPAGLDGDTRYKSELFCSDLGAVALCDIDPDDDGTSSTASAGNRDDCTCQGTDSSVALYESAVCGAVPQSRCSDGDPELLIGGEGTGLCSHINLGGGIILTPNCGGTSNEAGSVIGSKFAFENPPTEITPQRAPGGGLLDPDAGDAIQDLRTTAIISLEDVGTEFYGSVGRLVFVDSTSYWADSTFTAAAVTGGLDANITVRYCDGPEGWETDLPVEGTCSVGLVGGFCIRDADCDTSPGAGDGTCDPASFIFCSEQNTLNGYGFIWERAPDGPGGTDADTCPPECGTYADYHTGKQDAVADILSGQLNPRAASQVAFDSLEGPTAAKGDVVVIQPVVAQTWLENDFRCETGTAGLGRCTLSADACDFTIAGGTGGGVCSGAGNVCVPCDGTALPGTCPGCTFTFDGSTAHAGGSTAQAFNGGAIGYSPGEYETLDLSQGGGPGGQGGGRLGIVGQTPSDVRTPITAVTTSGAARNLFTDDTCGAGFDLCALGEAVAGTAAPGIGTGGSFAATDTVAVDPLGGTLGAAATWAVAATPVQVVAGAPFLLVQDYGPGADAIPGCAGDNTPASPCDTVLGKFGTGTTGSDDAPLVVAGFGPGAPPPPSPGSVVGRFKIADPTASAPMFNVISATTIRDLSVLGPPANTDVMTKAWTTWCPLVGECADGSACHNDVDCGGGGDCDNYERVCCDGDPLTGDADADGICDDADLCPEYAQASDTDSNGDGIPDDCQCGDCNFDGFILFADAQIAAGCVLSPATCTADRSGLGDTNNDGFLLFADAQRIAGAVLPGGLTTADLICARRCPTAFGGPGTAPCN